MTTPEPPPETQDSPHHHLIRYGLVGAGFGLLFPIFSTLIQAAVHHGSATLANMMALQETSPLLWVIDTAPFFLGIFAAYAGQRQDRLAAAMGELEKAYHELETLNSELEKTVAALESSNEGLERANADLIEAGRLKSQFLANMSHELRTPLNAIIGFSRIVLRKTKDTIPERQQRNLRMVHESGQHLLEMVNDLLDIERIEAGMLKVSLSELDAGEMTEDVVAKLRPAASEKGLTLDAVVEPESIRVEADPVRLRQILDNLVNNAIKYSDDGPRRAACSRSGPDPDDRAARRSASRSRIEGKGIAEDELGQASSTPSTRSTAAPHARRAAWGSGLHLVRRLAELHDGGCAASSPKSGVGSTFTFWMPASRVRESVADVDRPHVDRAAAAGRGAPAPARDRRRAQGARAAADRARRGTASACTQPRPAPRASRRRPRSCPTRSCST